MKKYKLTNETIHVDGHTLHRIEALKNFSNVYKGEKGGFVESEENLSHNGDCWVYGTAKVCGNARVVDNAKVHGDAEVYGNASISDNAKVCGNAEVYGDASVYNNASISDNAEVFGDASIYGDALIYGNAEVFGHAKVLTHARICDNAKVWGNTKVCGDAIIYGRAEVGGDAKVADNADYIVFKNWWSSGRYFTWTRSNNMWKVGCFHGTGEELIAKAYKDSELSGREYERVVKYVESILKDSRK